MTGKVLRRKLRKWSQVFFNDQNIYNKFNTHLSSFQEISGSKIKENEVPFIQLGCMKRT